MTVLRADTEPAKAEAVLRFVATKADGGEMEIEDLAGLYEKLPNAGELLREASKNGQVLITAGGITLNSHAWDKVHGTAPEA